MNASLADPDRGVATMQSCFDEDSALQLLEEVSRHDRFQASVGIERAAEAVAAAAEKAGLKDVEIHRWHPDGSRQWWTFAGPPPWTPEGASLEVRASGQVETTISYPRDRCALAAYSQPTPAGGVRFPVDRESEVPPAGNGDRVILMDEGPPSELRLQQLQEQGVVGFLCRAGGSIDQPDDLRRRVELPFDSKAFAFSLSDAEMRHLRAVEGELRADVSVTVSNRGRMPVVTGYLPGRASGELLVISHLCHPRPSANDNASGVAANLAVAACLATAAADRRFGVRFLWGPEFVGTVAYLRDLVCSGVLTTPLEAVNLDVVGQAQAALRVEHPPAYLGALLPATIERCLRSSEWEERPSKGGRPRWETAPFSGTSDHAVLVDRSVAIPTAHLGQLPDSLNHSSGDSLEQVDMGPLRRAALSVAAAIETLSQDPAPTALGRWLHESARARAELDQRARVDYARDELHRNLAAIACRYADSGRRPPGESRFGPPSQRPKGDRGTIERTWEGPFNLRSMLEDSPLSLRAALDRFLLRDGRAAYTAMLSLALEIRDGRPLPTVVERAASLSGRAIEPDLAEDFFEAICASGWAQESAG